MAFGLSSQTPFTIYSKIDLGSGYKNYSSSSITIPVPATILKGTASAPSSKQGIRFFINGINSDNLFIIRQVGRTVGFTLKNNLSKFKKPIIFTMEVVNK
jgi:hypothetical protein